MMPIRIDRDSIRVKPTRDPNVVIVTADVTTDPDTIKEPYLKNVSVEWNQNTGWEKLKKLFQSRFETESGARVIEESIMEQVGEKLR
jgi:hypothetical protein